MSSRQRNLFLNGLFVAIALGLFFFGHFLSSDDLNAEQQPIRIRTITAIVGANQTIEAQLHQTETATAQAPTGTFTPAPSSTEFLFPMQTVEIFLRQTATVMVQATAGTFMPAPSS